MSWVCVAASSIAFMNATIRVIPIYSRDDFYNPGSKRQTISVYREWDEQDLAVSRITDKKKYFIRNSLRALWSISLRIQREAFFLQLGEFYIKEKLTPLPGFVCSSPLYLFIVYPSARRLSKRESIWSSGDYTRSRGNIWNGIHTRCCFSSTGH